MEDILPNSLAELPERVAQAGRSARRTDAANVGLRPAAQVPLVVDLDGTLIRSDLLIESAFAHLGQRKLSAPTVARALLRGKAAFKHSLSSHDFDPTVLPYDEVVLDRVREARASGRPVYLASASHERLVGAVATHLGLFDGWFGTDADTNCRGEVKAAILVDAFGQGGFDYIGNDSSDLAVWAAARRAIAIRAPGAVADRLARNHDEVEHLASRRPTWRDWARLMRVHQYSKNALLFVPLVTSQTYSPQAVLQVLLAAIAFSLCASAIYIVNDLVDLQDDRGHRTKCNRPLANGTIPLARAIMAVPLLLVVGFGLAAGLSLPFLGVLGLYLVLTTAYSFWLKRKVLLDVLALASLYTLRVVAGAAVLSIAVSSWLLAFCLAIFLSLALIKRYVELAARLDAGQPDSKSRGYRNTDADMLLGLAAASGFNAVTVFILYAASDSVGLIYDSPRILWLGGPILTYWIARMLILAHRRTMQDDPVAFAITDRESMVCLGLLGLLIALAA